jgi:bifunctional DNA-binding transcriptional regulator/antitoxin component of YhaV-PrlF toxin-antitoxin module
MNSFVIRIDERGRITLPLELRKRWNLKIGDYIIINPELKKIERANIFSDDELSDPEVISALLKISQSAKNDFYTGKTKNLDDYVAEHNEEYKNE